MSKTALLCGANILSTQKSDILEYSLTNVPEYREFEVDESYFWN